MSILESTGVVLESTRVVIEPYGEYDIAVEYKEGDLVINNNFVLLDY